MCILSELLRFRENARQNVSPTKFGEYGRKEKNPQRSITYRAVLVLRFKRDVVDESADDLRCKRQEVAVGVALLVLQDHERLVGVRRKLTNLSLDAGELVNRFSKGKTVEPTKIKGHQK